MNYMWGVVIRTIMRVHDEFFKKFAQVARRIRRASGDLALQSFDEGVFAFIKVHGTAKGESFLVHRLSGV